MKYGFILFILGMFFISSSSEAQRTRRTTSKSRTTGARSGRAVRSGKTVSTKSSKEKEEDETNVRSRRGTRSSTQTATKRSARSGRATSSAPASARAGRVSTQSKSSTSTAKSPRSARSARSARSGRPTSSARRGRGGTTSSSSVPTVARAGSARSGSTPITSSAPAINLTPGKVQYAQPNSIDREEQLLSMESGKTRFNACMDDFCNDTDSVNPAGRCLCSANIAKLRPLEDKVTGQMKKLFQMTSNVEAAKLGIEYELFNESTLEKLGLNEEEDSENPWDLDNVDFGLDALLGEENKRKEGASLYKDAEKACKPYLDITASFKKNIVNSYKASSQKSCRAYENLLTGKLRKMSFAMQATYNKLQKTEHKEANSYDAGQCSEKVREALMTTAGCGESFANCPTMAILRTKRIFVKDILNKCQIANKNNVIWNKITADAVRVGNQHSKSLISVCANDLKDCMMPNCGEGWTECATDNQLEFKKNYCASKLEPCSTDKARIWKAFKTEAKSRGQKTLGELKKQQDDYDADQQAIQDSEQADQDAENKITQCETDKTNFRNCVNMRCENNWVSCAGKPATCATESFGDSCETVDKTNLITYFNNKISNAQSDSSNDSPNVPPSNPTNTESCSEIIRQSISTTCGSNLTNCDYLKFKNIVKNLLTGHIKCENEKTTYNGYNFGQKRRELYSLTGTRDLRLKYKTVKYGYETCHQYAPNCKKYIFKQKLVGSNITCNTNYFGEDPAQHRVKSCYVNEVKVANEGQSFSVN